VRIETRATEPIVPLRLFTSGTRTAANVSRGLMYAGMYGMFFFVGQFLQDVAGYSPLRTGLCFLPVPASVFLSSQLVSKVLIRRVHPKVLIMSGISLTVVALLMSTQLHAGASYLQIFVSLVLLGVGSGTALVPLTQAGLAGVEPADAGAASGLVNVTQQVGAALGLAVLVTVLSAAAGHAQLKAGVGVPTHLVHGLDMTFGIAAVFGMAALVMVALLVHLPGTEMAESGEAEEELARDAARREFELVDGEGFEWSGPELVA
jgi:predicted MFS family arabinose efflux permease